MNYAEILDRSAERTPERPAIIFDDRVHTYAEVREETARFAVALRRLGVQPGDRVGVMISPRPELAIAFFSVLRAGAVVVPVNVMYRPDEVAFTVNDSGATLVVTTEGLLEQILTVKADMPNLREIVVIGDEVSECDEPTVVDYATLIRDGSPDLDPVPREEDDLAAFAYSSGTTGFPKGSMHTHYTLRRHGEMLTERYDLGPDDDIMSVLPIFLLPSFMCGPALAFHTGATSVIRPKFDPEDFVKTVERHRVRFGICTPTMYHMLVDLPKEHEADLSSFRYALFGGSPMPPELRRRFEERFAIRTYQCYGSSETVAVVVSDPVDRDRRFTSVGTAMPGVRIIIVDDEGKQLPAGEVGEICIGSDETGCYRTMLGYWRRPEETEQAFVQGAVRMGDVGYLDDEGFLYLVDRKKDVIFVGGWSVFPVEVETVMLEHPDVDHVAVVAEEDERLGEVPVAYVQPVAGRQLAPDELIAFTRGQTAHYKCPRRIYVVDALPRNALGKILKRELRRREASTQS